MTSTEDLLRYLEGGMFVLEDYLLSSEVYWASGVPSAESGVELPQLSIGGFLLARVQAGAAPKTAEQQQRFESVEKQIETIHNRWQVAWSNKCQRSFHRRLNMWRDFLEEYRSDPQGNADRYPHEVRLRVMLQLLQKDTQSIEKAELELLSVLDSILRHLLRPGNFVWDAKQVGGFPVGEYWFLYGYLPKKLS